MGLIDIIQEPNKNESAIEEVSSLFWNSEIDQILTPVAAVQTSKKKPKSQAITLHRLLTNSFGKKREKLEKKQKLEERKKEIKRKREEKQRIKEMQGKLKKT